MSGYDKSFFYLVFNDGSKGIVITDIIDLPFRIDVNRGEQVVGVTQSVENLLFDDRPTFWAKIL